MSMSIHDVNRMLNDHAEQSRVVREKFTSYVQGVLTRLSDAGLVGGHECFLAAPPGGVSVNVPATWKRKGVTKRCPTWRDVCAWSDTFAQEGSPVATDHGCTDREKE